VTDAAFLKQMAAVLLDAEKNRNLTLSEANMQAAIERALKSEFVV